MTTATTEAPDTATTPAPGVPPAAPTGATGASWRLRHPKASRLLLYGVLVAVIAVAWVLLAERAKEMEEDRQKGLITLLQGISEFQRNLAPDDALRTLREEVLAKKPNDHVRLVAHLEEAAILDQLQRWSESEAAYEALVNEWPRGTPKGALYMPWATMRVRAGRVDDALALLERPGATDGFTAEEVASLRKAAEDRRIKDRSR